MPQPSGTYKPVNPAPENVRAALPGCTSELLLSTDAAGRLRWCNPALERLLGHKLPELAGRAWFEVLPATLPGALEQASAQLVRGQPLDGVEVELTTDAAAPVWLRITSLPLPGNEWLCVMRDITEARRSEREASRTSELLEMAQEFGRLGVWERSIPSGVGRWDRHVFGFWGLDPAAGTPSHEAATARIHPDDRVLMTYQSSTRRAGRYSQHYRVQRPDGTTRWIHSQWEVKESAAGVPDRTIGIMMDDTDVYELARSLGDTSAQLKLAIELGNIGIWRHDLETGRVHLNVGAQKVLNLRSGPEGLSLAELRSRTHPEDLERLVASARVGLTAAGPIDIEARLRNDDGSWRTVLTRRVLERAPDGTPNAFVGIALDVTEQAEERRRASAAQHRMDAAAVAAGIGIWSYDVETGERQWNETMFHLVGRSPALGAPSPAEFEDGIVHPADRQRIRNENIRLRASELGVTERRFRVTLPGGEIRWLQSRARRENLDGRLTILGVNIDVTEHHRAEEALRTAGERAALAARGAGIGTWELDLVGSDERWDEQMYRLRGLEPQEHVPHREQRLEMLHPDDRQQVFDARPQDRTTRQSAQYEFRVRWPDGSYRWLASRSIAVLDEAGRPLRRIGVNWDITETRLAEAAREESAIAQRENMAKSELLSRVSHELRTPLNAVLGFTQLLQGEKAVPEVQRARLGWIRSAAEHLLLLINDMLDLSGLATGELKLALQPVALAGIVDETLPLVEPLAAQHRVALQTGAIDGVVLADRTRLRQVLINLLTNGIKYNRGPGHVRISAAGAGGRVTLQVEDSGRGLSAEQIAHLFEPFNRLGAEREGIEGSGIGLVIVKALVERMSGAVRVCSTPGRGTSFSVELPAATLPEQPAVEAPARAPAAPAAQSGRVLCIEDNPVNMLLVMEMLAFRPGLETIEATTGEQGVRLATQHLPDLALIDMHLPDGDGFEVLRRLRADPRTAPMRCIALSANALAEDIARAMAAGFDDYWTKPIELERFLAGIDSALASTRGG